MAELPEDRKDEVDRLVTEGDELLDDDCYDEALARYSAAWNLLPEPREECPDAVWVLSGLGDAHFFRADFTAARQAYMTCLKYGGDADNPYLRLRLGQCLFELEETHEAANWLANAYLLEGTKLFDDEDPKYLAFIKAQLLPPPDGRPEGW